MKSYWIKMLFLGVGFMLMMGFFELISSGRDETIKKRMAKFNNSNIAGRVSNSRSWSKGSELKLENDTTTFYFRPFTDKNKHQMFDAVVEMGDSINKPANSNILILIKRNGERYEFEFIE